MYRLVLLLDFDGTLYTGDLPVHAYARHVAEQLDPVAATAVIDGMREFLEGKHSDRAQRLTVDLSAAVDGYQAVGMLAAASGLTEDQLGAAYRSARTDLAASAFALEAAEGLSALLLELRGVAHVAVVTNADAAGVEAVVDSIGLAALLDEVITDAGKPDSMSGIVSGFLARIGHPHPADRLLAVGDCWRDDLAAAHALGARTAYVDRFGRGDGDPTWRGPDFASMVPAIRSWSVACGAVEPTAEARAGLSGGFR